MIPSLGEGRGELPSNVFITSVDVEQILQVTQHKDCTFNADRICCVATTGGPSACDLGQSSTDADIANLGAADRHHKWVEEAWEQLPRITDHSQLKLGMWVGWKVCDTYSSFLSFSFDLQDH